jgi:hypothetical protein
MPSKKTAVISAIFQAKKRSILGELEDPVVLFPEIAGAIVATGSDLNLSNMANFWKDLTRSRSDDWWPEDVRAAGFSGADAIGEGDAACFKFVRNEDVVKQQEIAYNPNSLPSHSIQTLSIPMAMKKLARRDENWLAQVAARLHIVETHFALYSQRAVDEVSFLQTGVKLRRAEADVTYSFEENEQTWLVSVEAKGRNERIHAPQISRAAHELGRSYGDKLSAVGVVPFALKIDGPSRIYTVEFEPVGSPDAPLVKSSEGLFLLEPPLPGIS